MNRYLDDIIYTIIVNQEGQYSMWPAHHELPFGWMDTSKQGRKNECLAYILQFSNQQRLLEVG